MGWPVCNTTLEDEKIEEIDLWEGGITFHQLGLIISAAFASLATILSLYLIFQHATHYLRPREQRHIIRILLMVPVYSLVSFASYFYYQHAVYYEVLRDCYEAFAISAFFTLLCHYVAPDLRSQKRYFRSTRPLPWVWPLDWMMKCWGGENGIWRTPRSGLTWFNVIWVGVFQYCFVRVAMTAVAVATQAVGLYCVASLSPAFSHIWVMVIVAICVTIAMYCLIQFHVQLREDLAEHRPFLKLLSIKLVIFLSFWQTILMSFLTSSNVIKSSEKINTPDLKIGIPSVLLCIEMAIFAVLHLWAFAWQPYSLEHGGTSGATTEFGFTPCKNSYQGGFLGLKAIGEAFNPWDLVKAIGRAARWMFVGRKTRTMDPSYQAAEDSAVKIKPKNSDGESQAVTEYGGARGTRRYGPSPDEEGEELLSNAQANPISSQPSDSGVLVTPSDDTYSVYQQRLGRRDSDTLLLGRSRDGSYSESRPNLHVMTAAVYPQDLPHEDRMPSPIPLRYLPPSPDEPNQQKIGRFYEP